MSEPRRKPKKRSAAAKKQIRVRMYNVGFGDCFLLRIPTADGERRMLIDCGYHSLGKGKFSDRTLVGQIKQDLQGAHLDVVVATHRHQDHISGFGETDLWTDIGVEEVWLPFTAHPDASSEDPALGAWNGLMTSAETLMKDGKLTARAVNALGTRDAREREAVEFMLWNARANAPGIQNLLTGMRRLGGGAAKRRFLPDKQTLPSQLITPGLPGVTTHVLGPPRDPKLRKARKVPDGWGVTGGQGMLGRAAGTRGSPFGEEWRLSAGRLPGRRPFQDKSLDAIHGFNDNLLYAAKAVDGFLNGESLVLVVEFEKARILLTGDAEVGAWSAILNNPEALAIAASATFLKVGHHGSHNATPLVLIKEHLAKKTPAVISTQEGDGSYRNGIPYKQLIQAMDDRKFRYTRSDDAKKTKGIFKRDAQNRWVDCTIPC